MRSQAFYVGSLGSRRTHAKRLGRLAALGFEEAELARMQERNDLENLKRLGAGDELKFVLCDRADYEWSRALIRTHQLDTRLPVHLSPVHPGLDPRELAEWLLEDGLRVRLNLQLHKYIWGPDTRGV